MNEEKDRRDIERNKRGDGECSDFIRKIVTTVHCILHESTSTKRSPYAKIRRIS